MKHFILPLFLVVVGFTLKAQSASHPNLSVYPNPTVDYISISDPNHVVEYVAVYNLLGKRLKEFKHHSGGQYPVSDLPKNIYLVQLQDENRKVLKTRKVQKR